MDEFYQIPCPSYHPIIRYGLRVFFRLFYFYRIHGQENLPGQSAFLLASNHQSYFDPVMIGVVTRLSFCFMAWAALFRGPRWFARMISSFGAFPVDLEKNDPASYRLALGVLHAGYPMVIFPEGGRQVTGQLLELRGGAVRLAMHAGVPIVPARIEGAFAAWPKPRKWPRLFKPITITFGPPIPPPARGLPPREREQATAAVLQKLREFMSGETQ